MDGVWNLDHTHLHLELSLRCFGSGLGEPLLGEVTHSPMLHPRRHSHTMRDTAPQRPSMSTSMHESLLKRKAWELRTQIYEVTTSQVC